MDTHEQTNAYRVAIRQRQAGRCLGAQFRHQFPPVRQAHGQSVLQGTAAQQPLQQLDRLRVGFSRNRCGVVGGVSDLRGNRRECGLRKGKSRDEL